MGNWPFKSKISRVVVVYVVTPCNDMYGRIPNFRRTL